MVKRPRITAEEALEIAGFESELDKIDERIAQAAGDGLRCLGLELEIFATHEGWMTDVCADLMARGFKVENTENPTGTKVSW